MTTGSAGDLARAAGLGEVFTRQEALAAGMTAAQLRTKAARKVLHGVFTLDEDPTSLVLRARAALVLASPLARLCETTALALRGVDLPDSRLEQTVHIWEPFGTHGPEVAGVRVHHNALGRRRFAARPILGMPTVHPAECWLQSTGRLSVRDLVVLADGLMRRNGRVLTPAGLRETVLEATGQRGVKLAREALELARPGTDSAMETRTRLNLVEGGLPCPVVNHPWHDSRGYPAYSLDMAYVAVKLAVEYDGAGHGEVAQMRKDRTRRRRIEDSGWRIITATAVDIGNSGPLVASVRRALAERGVAA